MPIKKVHKHVEGLERAPNIRRVARLVAAYGEPTVRGILIALSRLDSPLCAALLRKHDLQRDDLVDVLQPASDLETTLRISPAGGSCYTVEVGAGRDLAGDGGTFIVTHTQEGFRVTDTLSEWTA